MGIKANQLKSVLSLKGETPPNRAGASAINDISYDTEKKGDINNSELNTQSDDLQGSKYNKQSPYKNPEA